MPFLRGERARSFASTLKLDGPEVSCAISSSSSSSSSVNREGTAALAISPLAARLPPRLPTLLGTGVGSTTRKTTSGTGVSGTERVGMSVFFLASPTQSLKLFSSSRSLSAPPKVRPGGGMGYAECSRQGVLREAVEAVPMEDPEGSRSRRRCCPQCLGYSARRDESQRCTTHRQARFSSLSPSFTRSAARVITVSQSAGHSILPMKRQTYRSRSRLRCAPLPPHLNRDRALSSLLGV